jgi:hypothetical protein
MPVEIRELVIRVTVDDGGSARPGDGEARAEIVAACVEEVMRVLRRRRER